MNAKKCDRCHCYFDVDLPTKFVIHQHIGLLWETADLCKKCNDELTKFMTAYEDKKEGK